MIFSFKKGGLYTKMNNRIKEIRSHFGLTQQKFADRIKVKRNTVATYEMGKSVPSDSAIALICKEFSVNEEWLRYGKGEPYIEKTKDVEIAEMLADVMHDGEDNFKHKLISALARLNDNDWNSLEKFIDLIKK